MALTVSSSLLEAMAERVRRPVVVVTGGNDYDLSTDLVSWSVERTCEHRAGSGMLEVANPHGKYTATAGPGAGALAPGASVTVGIGLQTAAGAESVTVFTGTVAATETLFRRGQPELLRVRLLDRAGWALQRTVTSPLYENAEVNAILTDLFTSYGGMAPTALLLDPVSALIPRLQFVEESLLDAGYLLAQAVRRRLFFDAQGRLRTVPREVPGEIAWQISLDEIIALQESRQAPRASGCLVTGCLQDPVRQVGDEVLWEEMTVDNYTGGIVVEVPFNPADAVYEEIRLEVVTALAPFEQVTLYSSGSTGIKVKVVSPGGRAITVRIYGKQVYYTTPYITALVTAPELADAFGDAVAEIANPAVSNAVAAFFVAEGAVEELRWSRHTAQLRLTAHAGIEPGDLLHCLHPRTGEGLLLLAKTVTHSGRRGREDATLVEGPVVNG